MARVALVSMLALFAACHPGNAPTASPPSPPPPRRALAASVVSSIDPTHLASTVARLAAFGTRHTLSDTTSPTRGIGAARTWIKAQLDAAAEGAGPDRAMDVSFDRHVQRADGKRVPRDTEVVNVMAVLAGAMPEARARRYYIVGHYDSRTTDVMDAASDAPGANDDASGVAVVIELARVMAHARFDATLVFLATAGEEQGLVGAKLHAEEARANGWDVRAVLNDDIVGDPSPLGAGVARDREIRVFSEGIPLIATGDGDAGAVNEIRKLGAENDSASRELARFVADVAADEQTRVQPLLVFRPDRFLRGGDHLAFAELGFTAVRFTTVEEHYDRQHQNFSVDDAGLAHGDVTANVDSAYLAGVAALDGVVLAHLANAPAPPENARVVTADLANDTLLRWSSCSEPDVAGYEIVWRATTSARWENVLDAGAVTEHRLAVNKDDVIFGVRAYDREGWRSPVTFARAAAK